MFSKETLALKAQITHNFKNRILEAMLTINENIDDTVGSVPVSLGVKAEADCKMIVKFGPDEQYAAVLECTKGNDVVKVLAVKGLRSALFASGTIITPGFGSKLHEPKKTALASVLFGSDSTLGQHGTYGGWGSISKASGGKSALGNAIAYFGVESKIFTEDQIVVVSAGEPESIDQGNTAEIFVGLFYARAVGAKYVLLDSMRYALNEMPGKLKTAGISRSLAGYLTQMHRIAADADMVAYIVINPSSSKQEVLDEIAEDMYSSMAVDFRLEGWSLVDRMGGKSLKLEVNYSTRYSDRARQHDSTYVSIGPKGDQPERLMEMAIGLSEVAERITKV